MKRASALILAMVFALMFAACNSDPLPKSVTLDGVEYVKNRVESPPNARYKIHRYRSAKRLLAIYFMDDRSEKSAAGYVRLSRRLFQSQRFKLTTLGRNTFEGRRADEILIQTVVNEHYPALLKVKTIELKRMGKSVDAFIEDIVPKFQSLVLP